MARDPKFADHRAMEVRHELEWETIRWPGETGTMIFHPGPHREGVFHTQTGGEILIVQYPRPSTGGRPIYEDRFNLQERRSVAPERTDG